MRSFDKSRLSPVVWPKLMGIVCAAFAIVLLAQQRFRTNDSRHYRCCYRRHRGNRANTKISVTNVGTGRTRTSSRTPGANTPRSRCPWVSTKSEQRSQGSLRLLERG